MPLAQLFPLLHIFLDLLLNLLEELFGFLYRLANFLDLLLFLLDLPGSILFVLTQLLLFFLELGDLLLDTFFIFQDKGVLLFQTRKSQLCLLGSFWQRSSSSFSCSRSFWSSSVLRVISCSRAVEVSSSTVMDSWLLLMSVIC